MEEHAIPEIEILISDAGEYVETKAALWKLRGVDAAADLISTSVTRLSIILIVTLFILILSIAIALLIGEWMGRYFYGFFIMAGFYGIAALICYANRNSWLKEPVGNTIIRKLLK